MRSIKASEIRQSFIDFFQGKGHRYLASGSLMPSAANLLFTNAGMNQFVPYFLGDRPCPYARVVNTQKCIRAGGKHNDLEDVGFDTYHHTFFEMLGNWSFGDYFKEEAIHWAWELLTQVWQFPKERLYITVYKPQKGEPASFDQESYNIWKALLEKEGLDTGLHIVYGNKKDNFWMMGDSGPCGPCSEIHMDLTPEGKSQGKLVNADSAYCIEIWNLVFIQFNAQPEGTFSPLTKHYVDTGMGLERVAGILATTKGFTDFSQAPSNYNSDLFRPIFDKIRELSGIGYEKTLPKDSNNMSERERYDCSFRVIADHIRTLSFSIADGILPGNEGRNYVLRRILRRALMFGNHLKLGEGFLVKLIDPVIEMMKDFFPEVQSQSQLIHNIITSEEKTFERTLERGLQLLDKITRESKVISAQEAFTLYDTYGFPIDLTELIAKERDLSLDLVGFEKAMEAQRKRARAAQKKTVIKVSDQDREAKSTTFLGYQHTKLTHTQATLKKVLHNQDKTYLVFDKTPFYSEMGGQVGDTGEALIDKQTLKVLDTIQDEHGHTLHELENNNASFEEGKSALLSVDVEKRLATERNHTATHLLHWALREVLGKHVKQAGSLVNDKHLRFDFSHFEAVSPEALSKIEALVNTCILENSPVSSYETTFNEKPENCIAFFGEKYGNLVRVVDIGGFSVELCGGTHVRATGEIGPFKIRSESAIAAGTRRLEAITGTAAMRLFKNYIEQVEGLAKVLSCQRNQVEQRILSLINEKDTLEKALRGYQQKDTAAQIKTLVKQAETFEGLKIVKSVVGVSDPKDMRGLAVNLGQQLGPSIVILGANFGEKSNVLALCSREAVNQGFHAGNIVKGLTAQLGGSGGGKADYAMGGGKAVEGLEEIVSNVIP